MGHSSKDPEDSHSRSTAAVRQAFLDRLLLKEQEKSKEEQEEGQEDVQHHRQHHLIIILQKPDVQQ
jgi:hypothetical protein